MGLDVIRDRSQLFKTNSDGLIENTYTLKILNKTQQPETYDLSVKGLDACNGTANRGSPCKPVRFSPCR